MSQLSSRCIGYKVSNNHRDTAYIFNFKYKYKVLLIYFVQYSFEFVYIKESDIIKYGLAGAQMNTILNNVKTCNNFVLIIFLTSEFVLCLCFLYNRKPILCFLDFFPVKQETN